VERLEGKIRRRQQPGDLTVHDRIRHAATELAELLRRKNTRIVFAESCTAGRVAASLSLIPGISEFLCGSAVTYRDGTKIAWLGVSAESLADPNITAVSPVVADQMCRGVMNGTPEADWGVSVTGHLGPGAPPELDGLLFIGVIRRGYATPTIERHRLTDKPEPGFSLRETRQWQAVLQVLQAAIGRIGKPD